MFRGKCCNHGVALALFVIRTPEMEMKTEEPAVNLLPITLPKLAEVRH
jgi:hypothetical protein